MSNQNDFVIENGVLKKFEGTDTAVIVPDGVTSIGDRAFYPGWNKSSNLTTVTLPEGLTSIGNSAFMECSSLTSITLPEGLKHIGDDAFHRCGNLNNINFPEGLISIGEGAFYRCGLSGSIVFPNSLQSIGKRAFLLCSYLKTVVLPDSITTIGDEAFEWSGHIINTSIPVNLTYIGQKAFYGCYQIKDGNLPKCLNCVGAGAFYGTGITAFSITPENKKFKTINGILLSRTGKKLIMFPPKGDPAACPIPESVEQIASKAFYGVGTSGYIALGKNVSITKSAFKDADSLFVTVYAAADAALMTNPIYIGNIDDLPAKLKNAAVKGFLYAEEHGIKEIQPYRQSYLEHIRRNIKTYLKEANGNEFLLRLLAAEKMIPEKEVDSLMQTVGEQENTALTALLLEYRQTNFGVREKDEFSLSDDDPDLKRRLKQHARQEEIKGQKGIKGLAFVATGDFENFGWEDEYTGAKDMSDLKAFIEERGGFLRSAVSGKTDYVICNDPNSDSVKSRKAKELGVPVIDEKSFLQMANETNAE